MKLCRFGDDRLGLVDGAFVRDVSGVLDELPSVRWPFPHGDLLISRLDVLREPITAAAAASEPRPLASERLLSPVANPGKIIGAPINYQRHIDESKADQGIAHGREIKTIGDWGLFLKATSGLVGPAQGVALRFADRRNDHEVELAVIIGRAGSVIAYDDALDHVAGYAIGLDMTVRGPELPSFRKSIDTYSVLGPWLVTADEVPDPDALELKLSVNGKMRQHSNTRHLVYDVRRLIEFASAFYTLHPGDIIMTGTPEGVGPVVPGDVMVAEIEHIGRMEVSVRAAAEAR